MDKHIGSGKVTAVAAVAHRLLKAEVTILDLAPKELQHRFAQVRDMFWKEAGHTYIWPKARQNKAYELENE